MGARHTAYYELESNPNNVVIEKFSYGGRRTDSGFCWHKEKWKLGKIQYWQRTISNPILRHSYGPGGWRTQPHSYLDFHTCNNTDVDIGAWAMTKDWLKYTEHNWCFNATNNFTGLANRHYIN